MYIYLQPKKKIPSCNLGFSRLIATSKLIAFLHSSINIRGRKGLVFASVVGHTILRNAHSSCHGEPLGMQPLKAAQ